MLDPIATDRGERELDRLIERATRGSSSRDKANLLAQEWAASEKRHREKKQEANRLAWYCYHLDTAERLRRSMTDLVEKHEAAAASLLKELPKGKSA